MEIRFRKRAFLLSAPRPFYPEASATHMQGGGGGAITFAASRHKSEPPALEPGPPFFVSLLTKSSTKLGCEIVKVGLFLPLSLLMFQEPISRV